MVIQLTAFDGMWSRKISQSARPRNRSSRRSRSVVTGAMGGFSFAARWGHNPDERFEHSMARRHMSGGRFSGGYWNVPGDNPQDRGDRGAPLHAGAIVADERLFLLGLHHQYFQSRFRDRAVEDPPLAHHRRLRPLAGGERAGRGGRRAGARARRLVRIYERRAAADAFGLHGRDIRNGFGRRRAFRYRDP